MAGAVGEGADDRLKLGLLAHVRQDVSAPVGAMVGYAEILVEDAPRYGLERFTPDLIKMHQASLALQRIIDDLLDPQALAQRVDNADYAAFRSTLRHDLRTPINAVKGYGEMLLEDADGADAEPFIHDLHKLLDAAQRLLARIDVLVELAGQQGAVGAIVPQSEG